MRIILCLLFPRSPGFSFSRSSVSFTSSLAMLRTRIAGSESANCCMVSNIPCFRIVVAGNSSVGSQIDLTMRRRFTRMTAFLFMSFWTIAVNMSCRARELATGGERRSSFCNGSSKLASNAVALGVLKHFTIASVNEPSSRCFSTFAVSS